MTWEVMDAALRFTDTMGEARAAKFPQEASG